MLIITRDGIFMFFTYYFYCSSNWINNFLDDSFSYEFNTNIYYYLAR